MRRLIPILVLFIGCHCDREPTPPYLPPGSGTGGTSGGTKGGTDGAANPAPEPADIPATANVQLVVSKDSVENEIPPVAPVVVFSDGSRIYIYAFWRGLQIGKIYNESFLVCAPNKARAEDECWLLKHAFVPSNAPQNPIDAVYAEPLGWMTKVSFDLALAEETLGIWRIEVWPTGQDAPKAEIYLEVI
ncbi:MAG: hypothetical protein AAB731_05205 [Patescibacteria group bacterium]